MDSNTARGACHGGTPCYSQGQPHSHKLQGNSTLGASCAGSNVTVVISPGLEMPNWGHDYAGEQSQSWRMVAFFSAYKAMESKI